METIGTVLLFPKDGILLPYMSFSPRTQLGKYIPGEICCWQVLCLHHSVLFK